MGTSIFSSTANPPGAVDMEIDVYRIIRTYAPETPVLLFSYAVFGGKGGAAEALKDIRAFNKAVLAMKTQCGLTKLWRFTDMQVGRKPPLRWRNF